MTTVLIRSPLDQLSMNRTSANNSRRRTTRHLFDEEDEPPAKRLKGDGTTKSASQGNGVAAKPAVNGRTNGATSKSTRQKKSYDEEDEGFAFSRARSTRSKAKAQSQPEHEASLKSNTQPAQKPASATTVEAPTKQATRKSSRKTLPVTPEKENGHAQSGRRRSKRLSGETEHAENAENAEEHETIPSEEVRAVDSTITGGKTSATAREYTQTRASKEEDHAISEQPRTDKKRRMTKIELVFAETPVIRRNKEMRKTTSDQNRRSSSGIRGKRASSLIDAGSSNAVPHSEVTTQEFYKHISQDLTEPRRMKQLLVWCGSRALPPKPSGDLAPDESQARHAARVIVDELLGDFGNRNGLSNWFDREDTPSTSLVKKPNPRNTQNAAKLQELEAELERLHAEKRNWDELLRSTEPQTNAATSSPAVDLDASKIDATLLDPSQVEILEVLKGPAGSIQQPSSTAHSLPHTQSRLDDISKSIEFKIDLFADSLHRLEQYRQGAERAADKILAAGAERLEDRDEERKEKAGGQADSMDVLRALSRASNKADKDKSR